MNALSIASGDGCSCTWSVGGHCIIGGLPLVGSFQPNATGHLDGYAKAFIDYIHNASVRTPAGMPANPVPLPDPPATHVASADSLTRLTVTTSTPAGPQCEGTLQAGQKAEVSADGLAPGASVRAVVSSPGLGKTNDQTVGTFSADAAGAVSGELTIPLAASGYTWAGASAGVAFIDLLGAGSDQSHTCLRMQESSAAVFCADAESKQEARPAQRRPPHQGSDGPQQHRDCDQYRAQRQRPGDRKLHMLASDPVMADLPAGLAKTGDKQTRPATKPPASAPVVPSEPA